MLLSVVFCLFSLIVYPQADPEEYQKKAEKAKEAKRLKTEEYQQKLVQRHYDIQSKEVKKRIKKNNKQTEKYYKKKLNQTFWGNLFKKKNKYKKRK